MRTLLGAADPEPWPRTTLPTTPTYLPAPTTSTTTQVDVNVVITFTASATAPATPATPPPYRTTAYVGEPIREIER